MRKVSYPSDLTGFQWSLIKPHLPVYPGGRPRKTDLRDVVDAIFYILRAGCQWRYLPKDFPPKSTVWRYFNQWRHNGTLETIHDLLRRKVRAAEKPYSPRTTASVDSQSVDTTSGGEQRGRDNAKNVDGRKRHIVVDSMGLLMAVLVTAASIDDAKAAAELFARLDGQPMSHVKRMYADSKYHNFILYEWVETNAAWELNIVQRPKDAVGWVLLPIRWTVERTFAWLGRCRRLSKDREKSVRSSEAFVKLAMIHLMLNRLAQKKRMPSSTIVRRHKPTCGTDTNRTLPHQLPARPLDLLESREPCVKVSRFLANRFEANLCGDVRASRRLATLVFGDDFDDSFRGRSLLAIVDVLDARRRGSDCLELFNLCFAVLERDAKCFWIGEKNGLVLVKLKIGNESEMVDVTLERFLQGEDIGSGVGGHSHIGGLAGKIMRQPIKINQGGKVNVLSFSLLDRVQDELADLLIPRPSSYSVDVVMTLFPDRQGVSYSVTRGEQMGLENLCTETLFGLSLTEDV